MDKAARLASLTLLSSWVVASCGGGGSDTGSPPVAAPPPASAPASVEHDILPKTIDPAVDLSLEAHVAINPSPSVTATNVLFVFLPGTDGTPDQYKLILKAGASRGFHTLGLNYQNGPVPVGVVCAASSDTNCFWNVRREIITGQDLSADVAVTSANSILTRLTKAIAYLNTTYPLEGWGQYLSNGAVNWSKVSVGGHSQGGGHAGVLAKMFSMHRACYFASPPDWSIRTNLPAPWMGAQPNVTPTSLQFGFGGLQDPSVPYSQLLPNWTSIGLAAFGAAVSVDGAAAPFNASHMLTTNATPQASNAVGTPLHGLTVRDVFTPVTSAGAPVFDAAWGYLCFQ